MRKAHCDIYKRVVAEIEHNLASCEGSECQRVVSKVIEKLRAYEKELNKVKG